MNQISYTTVILLLLITVTSAVETTCSRAIQDCERRYGIPYKLLHAISLVESGRKASDNRLQPWPWTINAAGKPYIMPTKAAAISKAKQLRKSGINSMDLGALQINSLHHPKAFASITEAFDIRKNTEYAANLLKANFSKTKSWFKAVADYHSKTPTLGEKYKQKVIKVWQQLLAQRSSDKASPNSVMQPSTTTIKNVDIKMVPLNHETISQVNPERRFIPISQQKTTYQFDSKTKTVYQLTHGRKFFRIH